MGQLALFEEDEVLGVMAGSSFPVNAETPSTEPKP